MNNDNISQEQKERLETLACLRTIAESLKILAAKANADYRDTHGYDVRYDNALDYDTLFNGI